MNEKISKFYEMVSADEALQAELQAVTEGVIIEDVSLESARAAMADAVAAFAAAHDLDLTAEDILAAEASAESELSEDELEAVNGGRDYHYEGFCMCLIVGASRGCGCFVGGKGKDMNIMKGFCALGGI